jgi:uncharacterized protein YcbK (DUF882 family)
MSDDLRSNEAFACTRRGFLLRAAGCAGLALAPLGAALARIAPTRSLSFVHTHTGEKYTVGYCTDGVYQANCLTGLNHFLRDFRTGEIHAMDPHLLDILYNLQVRADRDLTYEVISGFRSPETNAALHKLSHEVAVHSLHMVGQAIDVRAAGFATRRLHDLALSQQTGGIGFYAASDFVHLDTGRTRTWVG